MHAACWTTPVEARQSPMDRSVTADRLELHGCTAGNMQRSVKADLQRDLQHASRPEHRSCQRHMRQHLRCMRHGTWWPVCAALTATCHTPREQVLRLIPVPRTPARTTHTAVHARTQTAHRPHACTHAREHAWAVYAERRASTTRYLGSRPSAAGELCIDIYAAAGVGGTSLVRGIGAPTPVGGGWAIERASPMRACGIEAPAPLE